MRVLFIFTREQPQSKEKPLVDLEAIQFGISFVSSFLKQHGHQTRLLVMTRESDVSLVDQHIQQFNPHVIGFTAVATEYPFVERIARYIKERYPAPFLLAGGSHVSLAPEESMLDTFDALCIGEGEEPALDLVEQLAHGNLPTGIANLWIRHASGIEKNSARPFIPDLDALPYPDREMWYPWIDFPLSAKRPSLLLGRGCPYDCTYCCNHALSMLASGPYVRVRSPRNIIGEIEQILAVLPDIKEIYFEVETFCAKQDWSLEICAELERFNARRSHPLVFGVNIRVSPHFARQDMDAYFSRLKQAGFHSVNIGLESGSDRVRTEILQRKYSNEDLLKAVAAAKRQGIEVVFFNLLGLPTETLADFHETVAVNYLAQPHWHYLSIFFPYPGTRLHEICLQTLRLPENMLDQGMERVRATLDFPDFSRAQIQKAFIWFDYYVYRDSRPLQFLADLLINKYRQVYGVEDLALAGIIANDILQDALRFDRDYHPELIIHSLIMRIPEISQALTAHPDSQVLTSWQPVEVEPVTLLGCSLNLGELHRMAEGGHGYFSPVFTCRTRQGEEFTARMMLHITERLDELYLLDPRVFKDGGLTANSCESPYLARRYSYAEPLDSHTSFTAAPPAGTRCFSIRAEQILQLYRDRISSMEAGHNLELPTSVAFTCHDPHVVGGGNIILFRFINWLTDLGVQVTVYSCGQPPNWVRVQARFVFFENYEEMFSSIKEDVIILFSMWHIEPVLRAGLVGKKIHHLRQIFEPHHYGDDFNSYMACKPVIELLESLPLGVITISPHLAEWYYDRLGCNSLLVTNGVDERVFYRSEDKKSSPASQHIVSVGSPRAGVKGVMVLAVALGLLARRREDLSLSWTIASHDGVDNSFVSEMRSLGVVVSQVTIPGHNDMALLYHSADLCVNPSLYEGFGLPTLEAMACGISVVHADNRGLDHIVSHEENCLVVPVNNPAAIAEAIERILDNSSLAERLRQGGTETAKTYSLSAQYEKFLAAFGQILNCRFDDDIIDRTRRELHRNEQPLVSVIIPSYNQAEFLPETLDSILAQTYDNWEAIVINDGSTDNTESAMSTYAAIDKRIRVFSKPNGGISSALNEGLRQARGDFFCWLSSDDLFYPHKLELQVKAFKSLGPEYALLYGSIDILNDKTKCIEKQPFFKPLLPGAEFPEGLMFDFIDGCSIMIRMSAMREINGFNPYYRHSQDFELWVRLASRGYRFKLIDHKVTIRRVHEAQSSTVNSIHCRYDAAWMVGYYLGHFHLFEMYRYFDMKSKSGRSEFVEHLVGRMLHTEANINNPLLQSKFWNWINSGIKCLEPFVQAEILTSCLKRILENRSATYKMEYYLSACFDALQEDRCQKLHPLDLTMLGRDIRNNDRQDDSFAQELFDYGCDLFINEHTPRIVKDFQLHDMDKFIDTHYKLGHSVIRYLSQFMNRLHDRVAPYSIMSLIPQTSREAFELFCCLRYPQQADILIAHAELIEIVKDIEPVSALEETILGFPEELFCDLASVCSKHPTNLILYYWLALGCSTAGNLNQAAHHGLAALPLAEQTNNWWLAYRIACWCEQAGDDQNALLAYLVSRRCKPHYYESKEAISRILCAQNSRGVNGTPKMPAYIQASAVESLEKLEHLNFWPFVDGTMRLEVLATDGPRGTLVLPLEQELKGLIINDGNCGINLSARDIYEFFRKGYDFRSANLDFMTARSGGHYRPSIAFTLRWSSVLGGGPIIVYRFVNWLSRLGVDVTIYSDDAPPSWINLDCTFKFLPNDQERYSAITEPVVIFYSILEAQNLLRYCNTAGKRIYHICQAVEDCYYHNGTYESIHHPKPLFELLHSLPVGRIVVSRHLEMYFESTYFQSSHLIENGINLALFKPVVRKKSPRESVIMTCGNPTNCIKGSQDIIAAVGMLKQKYPRDVFKVVIVSGQQIENISDFDTSSLGFETVVACQLDQKMMQQYYTQADVYVNASWYEGFGLPTLEAMACGVPVVQTDNRGLDGIVRDGENCLIVPPDDPAAMFKAIESLIANEKMAGQLVLKGLETARTRSCADQFDMFVEEFQKILAWRFDSHAVSCVHDELVQGSLDDRFFALSSKFSSQ